MMFITAAAAQVSAPPWNGPPSSNAITCAHRPDASTSGCSHNPSQQWAMAWPPQSGHGTKPVLAMPDRGGDPVAGETGMAELRTKPGRSVHRQVSQSMAEPSSRRQIAPAPNSRPGRP